MGVSGLTTFVEGNRRFFHDVKFRDGPLVIDGCSLYFRLYFCHSLDQQHGGDYDAFSTLLTQFLSALAACNVQPYVVLDGGMDPSDKKFSTLRQRLQSKIREADALSHGRNGSVLPILTRGLFVQVLTQRGVPLVQCPCEADWEIACLARQWNCPVLTNDSDFYVFDLPGGYLPFRFFNWTNISGKAPQRYISARRYTTNLLCRWFGGMNRQLLPLCAVLSGNDYGTPKGTVALLASLDLSGPDGISGRVGGKASSSRIEGLLYWLASFSGPAEALEEVSRLVGEPRREGGGRRRKEEKGVLYSQLWAAMQDYHIHTKSSLAQWFSGGKPTLGGQMSLPAQLPECLSRAAARGLLAPLVLDVLVMRRVLLHTQVENSKQASSQESARAIRHAIYGLLLQRGHGDGHVGTETGHGRSGHGWSGGTVQAASSSAPLYVEEYDRQDLNLKRNQVEAHPLKNVSRLDMFVQAPLAVRQGFLLEVLGVTESALASIPPHLSLAVAVTGFWLRVASPRPSQPQLQSLLLGMVYGEVCRNNQPEAKCCQQAVPQLNWAAERSVWARLDRLRVRPGERRGLDLGVAHSYSQWQACLWSAHCLNHLLLLPLPEAHMSWLFSGSLVHGLLKSLRGQPAETLLAGGPISRQLYCSLLDAVGNCNAKTSHPGSSASEGRKRGSRRGRRGRGRGAGGGGRETEDLNNRFSLLMSEEEFDE